jgi:hypothetical protein
VLLGSSFLYVLLCPSCWSNVRSAMIAVGQASGGGTVQRGQGVVAAAVMS